MRLVAVLAYAALIMPATVFAQAGSTGGTIGNTDKSIGPQVPTARAAERKPPPRPSVSLCQKLPGVWEWFTNGDVTVRPNGTAIQPASGISGNWSCHDRDVIFHWSHGFTDRLTLSTDGNHLTGTNGIVAVWGNRKG